MRSGAVERAVRADLRRLSSQDAKSALAVTALTLARQLDLADTPQAAAVVGRELRITLVALAKLAPATARSGIDELRDRRATRQQAAKQPGQPSTAG